MTQVYTNGEVTVYVDWVARGYRLPTEAEWEKAARGGRSNQRFPWGNTIDHSWANYYGYPSGYSYDFGYEGYDTRYDDGVWPYTSPVGSFPANGYGLYDMGGNVWQWCWDWYQGGWYGTAGATQSDTRGPTTSEYGSRLLRGGHYYYGAYGVRCANRSYYDPSDADDDIGFRCVR